MIAATRRHGVKPFTAHTEEFMAQTSRPASPSSPGGGAPGAGHRHPVKAFGGKGRPPWFLDREKGADVADERAHMIDRLTYILDRTWWWR